MGPASHDHNEAQQATIIMKICRIAIKYELRKPPVKIFHNSIPSKKTKEVIKPAVVPRMFEQNFSENETHEKDLSQEDKRFLKTTERTIHVTQDGHYEICHPFREENVKLPFNMDFAGNI